MNWFDWKVSIVIGVVCTETWYVLCAISKFQHDGGAILYTSYKHTVVLNTNET